MLLVAATISVTTDSPVTVGTPIRFNVEVIDSYLYPFYTYVLEDNSVSAYNIDEYVDRSSFTAKLIYRERDLKNASSQTLRMHVRVYYTALLSKAWLVGEKWIDFTIQGWLHINGIALGKTRLISLIFLCIYIENLIVSVVLEQNNQTVEPNALSSVSPIHVSAVVRDPSGFFDNHPISYLWDVENVTTADFMYNCTEGSTNMSVVVGIQTDERNFTGMMEFALACFNPIINITRNPSYVTIYQNINIHITFGDASPPITCNYHTIAANTTSPPIPMHTNERYMDVPYYFNKLGTCYFNVSCSNRVSKQTVQWEYIIYDSKLKLVLLIC